VQKGLLAFVASEWARRHLDTATLPNPPPYPLCRPMRVNAAAVTPTLLSCQPPTLIWMRPLNGAHLTAGRRAEEMEPCRCHPSKPWLCWVHKSRIKLL